MGSAKSREHVRRVHLRAAELRIDFLNGFLLGQLEQRLLFGIRLVLVDQFPELIVEIRFVRLVGVNALGQRLVMRVDRIGRHEVLGHRLLTPWIRIAHLTIASR